MDFRSYGLDKIKDSFTEDQDYKDNDVTQWELVNQKTVMDSDGFMTDYSWYTNGEKNIFMFGDSDIYEPDEDYADWVTESQEEALDWFNSYNGFEEELNELDTDDDMFDVDESICNRNFMNEGFNRAYGKGLRLED